MELKERVSYLKKTVAKLEQGIYYVEKQVIPRFEVDKNILADIKKDLIKAEAELNAKSQPQKEGETEDGSSDEIPADE